MQFLLFCKNSVLIAFLPCTVPPFFRIRLQDFRLTEYIRHIVNILFSRLDFQKLAEYVSKFLFGSACEAFCLFDDFFKMLSYGFGRGRINIAFVGVPEYLLVFSLINPMSNLEILRWCSLSP